MGDPDGPRLDTRALLDALDQNNVEYLIVGGIAANIYGAERQTNDVDVVLRWSDDNLDRAADALAQLDAGLRIEGLDQPLVPPIRDGQFISTMELSTWRSDRGEGDCRVIWRHFSPT